MDGDYACLGIGSALQDSSHYNPELALGQKT